MAEARLAGKVICRVKLGRLASEVATPDKGKKVELEEASIGKSHERSRCEISYSTDLFKLNVWNMGKTGLDLTEKEKPQEGAKTSRGRKRIRPKRKEFHRGFGLRFSATPCDSFSCPKPLLKPPSASSALVASQSATLGDSRRLRFPTPAATLFPSVVTLTPSATSQSPVPPVPSCPALGT